MPKAACEVWLHQQARADSPIEEHPDSAPASKPLYRSPIWDPYQIDLLGLRMSDAEVEELQRLEADRSQPDYVQKVDQLIASKLVAYGITTYEELFSGTFHLENQF